MNSQVKILPDGFDERDIVGRARTAMPIMADCGAEIFLSGHLHASYVLSTAKRYRTETGRSALVVQAGTATSDRVRGEAHSFNVIEFDDPILTVKRMELNGELDDFEIAESRAFLRDASGWKSPSPETG